MFIILFVVTYYIIYNLYFVITVTLFGRTPYLAYVYADGDSVAEIYDPDTTTEISLPDNTRLLAVRVYDYTGKQPGIIMKLSNGFITGSHWKCHHSPSGDLTSLTYDDSAWPQALIYSWPRGEHYLHPAQFISGRRYRSNCCVRCRGWVSKYIKYND